MSGKQDDFDPDDVLKGWSPAGPHGERDDDPTQVLDGWGARAVREEAAPRRPGAQHDVIDLPHVDVVDRRDMSDLGQIGASAMASARAHALDGAHRGDDVAFTEAPVVVHRHVNPRLLTDWAPGAWTGAVQRICGATTEFAQTPQGPVIETYPPQVLLALWAPQNLDSPLLGRWPLHVMLSAAEADRASDDLLPWMPPDAMLWLTHADVDWGLVGELVLHHDAALRPFQLKALREFVDATREATFARLNRDFGQPAPGQPITARRGL